jgi:uncharacterized protein (UPF0333 family)
MKTINTQKGFAALESLLILIIIAIIGGTGYYVWHSKQQTDKTLSGAANLNIVSKQNKKENTNLKIYHDSTGTFSLKYPTDAKIDISSDDNTSTVSSATITFKDSTELSVSNGVGGRGIPYDCSYDATTGKTTWTGPSSGPCPYMVISDAKKLTASAYDENGNLQNVYLVDNNYTTYNESGQAATNRTSCLILGPVGQVGKKVYGLTFVNPELSGYKTKDKKGTDSFIFISGCTKIGDSQEYFNDTGIKEAKAVLASFNFDNK